MEVGYRLRAARLKRGLTVTQLASAAGVAESSVRGWERGRTRPRDRHAIALARALQVSAAWLLLGESELMSVPRPELSDEP